MKKNLHTEEPCTEQTDRFEEKEKRARQIGVNFLFSLGGVTALMFFLFWGWPEITDQMGLVSANMHRNGIGFGTKGHEESTYEFIEVDWPMETPFQDADLNTHEEPGQVPGEVEENLVQPEAPPIVTLEPTSDENWLLEFNRLDLIKGDPGATSDEFIYDDGSYWKDEILCTKGYPDIITCELPVEVESPDPELRGFIWAEEMPEVLNIQEVREEIGYPAELEAAGIEGRVHFRVLIDKEGNYLRHKVINSEHPELTRLAAAGLTKLRFKPAIHNGMPINCYVTIPFKFEPQT